MIKCWYSLEMGFNALKYVEELRAAGFPDKQAEAQVRLLNDIVDSDLATKRDIKELDLKIESTKNELKRDIKELDLKIESTKNELKRDIKELELKLKHDLTLRLGSLLVIGIGVIATLVKVL